MVSIVSYYVVDYIIIAYGFHYKYSRKSAENLSLYILAEAAVWLTADAGNI